MADEQKQPTAVGEIPNAGEEASVASPAEAEEAKAPEAQATPEAEAEAKATEEAATSGETEAEAKAAEGKRPTRAERRIQNLIAKLREVKAATEQEGGEKPQADTVSDILGIEGQPPWQGEQSPFKPGEEIPVEKLEAELNRRAAALAELKAKQVLNQFKQQERITRAVDEFAGELERLTREVPELNPDAPEYDPELDKKFSDLVVAVNSDEKGQFLPKKKPSEIFEALKAAMEKARTRGQAETTAKMVKSMANAAVTPTAGATGRKDYDLEESFRKAQQTGSTDDWAEYLKKRLFKKRS